MPSRRGFLARIGAIVAAAPLLAVGAAPVKAEAARTSADDVTVSLPQTVGPFVQGYSNSLYWAKPGDRVMRSAPSSITMGSLDMDSFSLTNKSIILNESHRETVWSHGWASGYNAATGSYTRHPDLKA